MFLLWPRRAGRFVQLVPVLAVCAFPVFPSALQQMNIDEMTRAATEVVQGTVTGSYIAQSGRTIFTHYKIQVSQRWKGPGSPTADVAVPGGQSGGVRQNFPGVPALLTGHKYILFLWTGHTGPTQLVGLNQGVFEVSGDGGNPSIASRPAIGDVMLDANGHTVTDRPVRMRVAELRTKISAVIKGGQSK